MAMNKVLNIKFGVIILPRLETYLHIALHSG